MRRSKLYKKQVEVEGFDPQQRYGVAEAIALLKKFPGVKFDQTAEVAFKLGVDPRKSDQTVRGAVALPAGTGKSVRPASHSLCQTHNRSLCQPVWQFVGK